MALIIISPRVGLKNIKTMTRLCCLLKEARYDGRCVSNRPLQSRRYSGELLNSGANGHLVVTGGKQKQSLALTIRLILDRGRN